MMPTLIEEQTPVAPPTYHRAQAQLGYAPHIGALTLIRALHLLLFALWQFVWPIAAVPPPLPASPGEAPHIYSEESLLLISLLRTLCLWRLSYQDMHDWLKSWPALAQTCGLPLDQEDKPRIPSPSQQCKRRHVAVPSARISLCARCFTGSAISTHRSP